MNIKKSKTTREYKRRKKIGQFFTESKLVDDIVDKFELNFDNKSIIEPSCGDGVFIKKIISCSSIYKEIIGIDIDKNALKLINPNEDDNVFLRHSDFLKVSLKDKVDMVIGNPPFNLPNNEYVDSTEAFLSKGIDLLKDGGELILIVPNTILRTQKYESLRKKILSDTKIVAILNTSYYEFLGADIETVAIYLKKEKTDMQKYIYFDGDRSKTINLMINSRKTITLDNQEVYIELNRLINGQPLGDVFEIFRGRFGGKGLRGRNIDFYNDFIDMNNGNDVFIAVQNIAYRIVANVVKGNVGMVNETVTILKPKKAMSINKLKYIANFLNSSITYFNLHVNCLNNCRLTVHIDKYYISDLNIPILSDDECSNINKYLIQFAHTKELSIIRNEIFYQQYSLSQYHICEIEKYWVSPKFKIKEANL